MRGTLRTKFLLSLALISALLTAAVLLTVRQRVQVRVRDEITEGLRASVATFNSQQRQREATFGRWATLLATLPPLRAVMTSQDFATIQDASEAYWQLAGSQLFVLADRTGRLMALHASSPAFTSEAAQQALTRDLATHEATDWWFGGGHLFQVFLQPIYLGGPGDGPPIGLLVVGYEIDDAVAAEVARVSSSRVGFAYGKDLVVSTVAPEQREALAAQVAELAAGHAMPDEIRLGSERFLVTAVRLSAANAPLITLTVLKSFDEATTFLESLNRWILAIGIAGVLAGSVLVFLVSTTFTRPLGQLVSGVKALEAGDFSYPLEARGSDEVATLTTAFKDMRSRLKDAQKQIIEAERLATIGRMAHSISHDLRHPLTAIQAYAEFLSERQLTDAQRRDYCQEISIGVNKMTDQIDSLLGFSRQQQPLAPVEAAFGEVIEHAIKTVKALPEYAGVSMTFAGDAGCRGSYDPGKFERIMLNLLLNAAEAVSPVTGRIDVTCAPTPAGAEIRVADNGPGIPEPIRGSLFQPFTSHGKEKGIGLGLTVVHDLMRQHGGEVRVDRTGPDGTTFVLLFR